MSDTNLPAEVQTAEVVGLNPNSPAVLEFAKLAAMLPTQDGDGGESIIASILAATTVQELDNAWQDAGFEKILNKPIEISEMYAKPSDFTDGLGVFLLVKGNDLTTGEEFTWTTGALATVAQLVKAYAAGWLPLRARLVQSARPTKDGYYPQHLVIDPKQA